MLPTFRTYRPVQNGLALVVVPFPGRTDTAVMLEHNPATGATTWLHTIRRGA